MHFPFKGRSWIIKQAIDGLALAVKDAPDQTFDLAAVPGEMEPIAVIVVVQDTALG